MNSRISVIIPVYNAEHFLPECIESLMNQNVKDAEFIFVDDGSSDLSVDILKEYAQKDSRIQIYQQNNSYAGVARNNGMSHAHGEYITFLDSDDIMMPNALTVFLREADKTGADVILSSAYYFKEDPIHHSLAGWVLNKKYLPENRSFFSGEEQSHCLFQISSGMPWAKVFRRSLIEENRLKYPSLPRSEDFPFVYGAFSMAKTIAIVDEPLILYRMADNPNSLEQSKDKSPAAFVEGYDILWSYLVEHGKSEQLKQTFYNALVLAFGYNFSKLKTVEGYHILFDVFRNEVLLRYPIDFDNTSYYFTPGRLDYLKKIVEADSFEGYLFDVAKQNGALNALQRLPVSMSSNQLQRLRNIEKSTSYRIGRIITFVPRKICGGIQCCKDHGLIYTIKRGFQHLGLIR